MLYKTSFLFAALLSGAFLFHSCSESSEDHRFQKRPGSTSGKSFKIDLADANLQLGDTLILLVKGATAADSVTHLQIFSEGSPVPVAEGNKTSWQLPTTKLPGGKSRLRLVATFASGNKSTRYKEINITAKTQPEMYSYKVVGKYPHDVTSYTQGLLFANGYLYEGTGQYGSSALRKVDLTTGNVLQEAKLDNAYFGEGVTIFNDKIYQITYKAAKCLVYDLQSLDLQKTFTYRTETGEGWGLTSNDTALIMSDGSSWLYYRDPETFEELARVQVFTSQGNQKLINELEYYKGKLYANIYTEPYIAIIDPATGLVEGYINLSGILTKDHQDTRKVDVLNGIAVNPLNGNLIITGKYWPAVYEIVPVKE